MTFLKTTAIAAATLSIIALSANAGGHGGNPAVDARQGHMLVMALSMGVLGGMARGNTDYDAEAAQAAADNLVTMGNIDQRFYWPPGSDSDSVEGSRALAAIWEDPAPVFEIAARYGPAAEALAAAAGQGLDEMRAAIGGMGAVCGDCHEASRVENN